MDIDAVLDDRINDSTDTPSGAIQRLIHAAHVCKKTTPILSLNYPRIFLRLLYLRYKHDYLINEAYGLGLLEPELSEKELKKFVSKNKMMEVQRSLNPELSRTMVENKGQFYLKCNEFGLPVPKLFAIYDQTNNKLPESISWLQNHKDLENYFENESPKEFVIKPSKGAYGIGVLYFRRTENGFLDAAGKTSQTKDILKKLSIKRNKENDESIPDYISFIIQERLTGHPDLRQLSNTSNLQTCRIITKVDDSSKCQILHSYIRPIVGDNFVDNHNFGRTGNLMAEINPESGKLKSAVSMIPDGSGFKEILNHPITGIPFEGFQLPFWSEAYSLAKSAAIKFQPLRNVGWDVAITPKGPYLIEGNWNYDPPNFHKIMDNILSELKRK